MCRTRDIVAESVLRAAFAWLCERRIDYAASSDVWNVRRRWAEIEPRLRHDLRHGLYRFSPLRRFQAGADIVEVWGALDALVLKALAIVLNQKLEYPATCYHAPGKDGETRGAKAAVRNVCAHLPKNRFVFRSDVKSYYASIGHGILLSLVRGPRPIALS